MIDTFRQLSFADLHLGFGVVVTVRHLSFWVVDAIFSTVQHSSAFDLAQFTKVWQLIWSSSTKFGIWFGAVWHLVQQFGSSAV